MATPLACIVAYLAADTGLIAIQEARVSENAAPQKTPFPRTVIEAPSRAADLTFDGASGLQTLTLRIQAQALDKASPEAILVRVRALLNGYRGALGGSGGITVQGAFEGEAPDDYDPAINAGETGVFVIAADYEVVFTITP